ncbi:hypothetical protein QQ056_09375 [Oscillatoria laete-virens NRMC-F 0139]|nr:hypothetical protein [Oscillatoria laete-virens]MDL5053753.1 hypothetical protein [Oscillatoria laete-virens NRMC-F 0139]
MTRCIDWRDCIGNPYLINLRPEMLSPQGAVISRFIKIPHQRSLVDARQAVDVRYDRGYVTSKIRHLIIEPLELQPTDYNEFIALVAAAWRDYQRDYQGQRRTVTPTNTPPLVHCHRDPILPNQVWISIES